MGTTATLLCIGPFDPEIADCLDYSPDTYDDVKPGTRVISELFYTPTSASSRELALAVGADLADFNTHPIRTWEQINLDALREIESYTDNPNHTEQLRRLWEKKFVVTLKIDS